MIKLAPSLLSADFSDLRGEVIKINKAGAHFIHLDIMDGHFVPQLTIGPMIVHAVNKLSSLPLDIHLMIENPDNMIKEFITSTTEYITIHAEVLKHMHRSVENIKAHGSKAGISINPATPIHQIEEILPLVDLVLIMTVNPGFGGQKFIKETIPKIEKLKRLKENQGYSFWIEVDGGINRETIPLVADAGAEILVSGSAVFHSQNPVETIEEFIKIANVK